MGAGGISVMSTVKAVTKKRTAYFDNAKFLLMILVVFSHFLQPFISDNKLYHDLYYFIFTFHMPAFALISGYFAKPLHTSHELAGAAKKLLAPYLFFQVFYTLYYWLIGLQDGFDFKLLTPQWSLWFLLSLFFWQASLVFFQRVSAKTGLFLAVALSIGAGYLPFLGQMLTLQRTFVFLPFFLIGYYLPKNDLRGLQQKSIKKLACLALPLVYLFIAGFHGMNKYMVFGSKPYEDYLSYPLFGGVLRAAFFIIGLLGIMGFMYLVPRKKTWYTHLGKRTLLVYLLQGIVIKGMRGLAIAEIDLSLLGLATMLLVSVLLTLLFASGPVQRFYQKIEKVVFPRGTVLLAFLLL